MNNFKKNRLITTNDSKTQRLCLRKISEDVLKIDEEIFCLVKKMIDIKGNIGCGIAAPQIGVNLNVVVFVCENENVVMINPKWINKDEEKKVEQEGCLSLMGKKYFVERYLNILVKYIDLNGKQLEKEFIGGYARIIQHECDHLNGIMICDKNVKGVTKNEEIS